MVLAPLLNTKCLVVLAIKNMYGTQQNLVSTYKQRQMKLTAYALENIKKQLETRGLK